MAITTLKVLASLLQMHGPGATVQSDHQGIDALLSDLQRQNSGGGVASDQSTATADQLVADPLVATSGQPAVTQIYFRRGFVRAPYAGAFRRGGGYHPGAGAFRRGGFLRGY
jgi:hypothetical protein